MAPPLVTQPDFYALTFILCFLAFEDLPASVSKTLHYLGGRSYGIYLLHPVVLMLVAPTHAASFTLDVGEPGVLSA